VGAAGNVAVFERSGGTLKKKKKKKKTKKKEKKKKKISQKPDRARLNQLKWSYWGRGGVGLRTGMSEEGSKTKSRNRRKNQRNI